MISSVHLPVNQCCLVSSFRHREGKRKKKKGSIQHTEQGYSQKAVPLSWKRICSERKLAAPDYEEKQQFLAACHIFMPPDKRLGWSITN